MAPISIDGMDITGATIDGENVSEITVDGDVVWTAIANSMIDDFEDGNLSEYSISGSGSTSVTSARPYNGNYSLEMTTPSSGGTESVICNTSQSDDVQRGYVYRLYFYRGTSDNRGRIKFHFGKQDANNYYYLYTHFANNNTSIRKRKSGSNVKNSSSGSSLPRGSWVYVDIDWDSSEDGTITISPSWTSAQSISDTEWSSGSYSIHVQCASNVTTWFDDIQAL